MKLQRRKYQTRSVSEIAEALVEYKRVIAVGPTGCGKTAIASLLIKRETKYRRVLFVAHRYELIDQAHAALTNLGISAGVIMAQDELLNRDDKSRAKPKARVQVASVQTIDRRGGPDDVDLIVFDEAHRVMSDSYQRVAARYPRAHVLGLTATPVRNDGRGLGDFFRHLYIIAKPSDLYDDGHLAKPRVFTAPVEVLAELSARLKGAQSANGDYTPGTLARVVDSPYLIGKVVSESIRIAPGLPKVVFAGSVDHSKSLALAFKRRGVKAAHLDGDTPLEDRRQILADLRSGKLEVVCNVDVLSEGWDLPALGAVVLARPTKSLARYLQMCGRCMRFYKGRLPIIVDHGNNTLRHQRWPGDDIEWSLGGSDHGPGGNAPIKSCCSCHIAIPANCDECPECGAEQECKRARIEAKEIDAKLEEIRRAREAELRERAMKIAAIKGVGNDWVDAVVREIML